MISLSVTLHSRGQAQTRQISIDRLVIAGWTGRDTRAVHEHIEELARLGVPRPVRTPMFYEIAAARLTTGADLQVVGQSSTGEVECVYVQLEDGLWIGVGSDHTDRKLETVGVALSKQVCGKPVGAQFWRFEDIRDQLDDLLLRSWATIDGRRQLYQEGAVATMRRPEELIGIWSEGRGLTPGTAMFGGTLAVRREIAFATRFEMELYDASRQLKIAHEYQVTALAVAG